MRKNWYFKDSKILQIVCCIEKTILNIYSDSYPINANKYYKIYIYNE